ncbi:MAG: Nucleoside-triphosphatase rdgB [Gemmatimonadetes bacterium]|nr:Nucleoside-triphosphatase rdgB [Gemmatimonadota bacterium]
MAADAWVLATRNAGKLRELRVLLAEEGIPVVDLVEAGVPASPDEDAVECFDTFAENALAKARYFAARLPGRTVVADDSGLEVRALDGEPGVRSRRWSGGSLEGAALEAANNARLVRALAGVADRRARFVCAAAWVRAGREVVTEGDVAGRIVDAPSGGEGFGYDPHFYADELGMTLADASVAEKQRVSHRGRAFEALLRRLRLDGALAGAS